MRVALFFDGKNFYEGLRRFDPLVQIDFAEFSRWVTRAVAGETAEFAGAYYYTGHSASPDIGAAERGQALSDFLDYLDTVPGFFVRREPRVLRMTVCRNCRTAYEYPTEKRVDTRMVAELIQYAAVNSYDVAVLASGDDDFVPAVEAVDRLGKRVYVGTWPGQGLARDLRRRAFDRVDFGAGLQEFVTDRARRPERQAPAIPYNDRERPGHIGMPRPADATTVPASTAPASSLQDAEQATIRELQVAEAQLAYVSRWYFVNKWRGEGLPVTTADRERVIDGLVALGHVDQYELVDPKGRNTAALRLRASEGES